MRWTLMMAFSVAMWIVGLTAHAEEPNGDDIPLKVTAEPWRVMTRDGSRVTSDCIGEGRSPVCLIDTLVACRDTEGQELGEYWDWSLPHRDYCEGPFRSADIWEGSRSSGIALPAVVDTAYNHDGVSYYRVYWFVLEEGMATPDVEEDGWPFDFEEAYGDLMIPGRVALAVTIWDCVSPLPRNAPPPYEESPAISGMISYPCNLHQAMNVVFAERVGHARWILPRVGYYGYPAAWKEMNVFIEGVRAGRWD